VPPNDQNLGGGDQNDGSGQPPEESFYDIPGSRAWAKRAASLRSGGQPSPIRVVGG